MTGWSIVRTTREVLEIKVKRVGLLSPENQVKTVGPLVTTEKRGQ
jgi:hypothetical protein